MSAGVLSTGTVLDRILDGTRARLAASPPDVAALEAAIQARLDRQGPAPDAMASLRQPGVRIIAEVKRASPSEGAICADADPIAQAAAYADAGAAAISVLTEPDHFGGSLADLGAVTARVALPCLRKDFIVDEVQLLEAKAHGASLVLLIVAALDDPTLARLHRRALELDLAVLVEAHTAEEVDRAVALGAPLIGVNCRNLKTFDVDLAVAETLRDRIPDSVVAVAESGIHQPADVSRLRRAGYDVFLVGTSLMRAADPAAQLRALRAAP